MTKNGFFKTLKLRLVLCLTILCLLFSFAFTLSACGDDDKEEGSISYPSASKIEDDEALVKNGGFEYGAYNLSSSSFPVTSVTGWSIATDKNAQSSNITSVNRGGVVDKSNWTTTLEKFYKSSSFYSILEKEYGALAQDDYASEIGFDKAFGDKNENRVLMLNAYNSSLGGSAVKATASNSITLDKNSYYKVSVDVYTANLLYNENEGANFRLTNTINGTKQAEVGIFGIKNDAWTTYTMYIKTDEELDCAVTLVLGLGRGGDNASMVGTNVQGTAFFDNAIIEKLNDEDVPGSFDATFHVDFGGEADQYLYEGDIDKFCYYMNDSIDYDGTTDTFSTTVTDVEFESTGSIDAQTYKFVSFDIDTSSLDKQDIYGATVYVVDGDGRETEVKNYKYSEEKQNCKILLKNNFPEGSQDQDYTIKVKLVGKDNPYLPTTGTITLSEISYIIDDKDYSEFNEATYNLVSSIADKTVSLYAGFPQDYNEPKDETYTFNVAKNVGEDEISSSPVAPDGYKGITPNSIYLNNQADNPDKDFNTKIFEGKAGLVNSKYTYGFDIPPTYEITNGNNYIQPLFITNNSESYGFIGEQKTISANSYATVSLKVCVQGFARAFIYIIDLDTMEPMTFTYKQDGVEVVKKLVSESIASDMDEDGWATVNFYIATGKTAKNFRVELWNGSRDSETTTTGTVFFDDITISTSASNFESERYEDLFVTGTLGKLIDETNQKFDEAGKVLYTRELTETEIKFNKEYPDEKVSYRENYIWAEGSNVDSENNRYTTIYAVYNTIDVAETDPYENVEEETTTSGCGETDSSTFWLSFSSILLIVALVIALIALIIKRTIIRRKRNASDAKSHYKVTSRYNAKKDAKKEEKEEDNVENEEAPSTESETEEVQEEVSEEPTGSEEPKEEPKLDDYVYGEVQNFGEDLVTNEEIPTDDVPAVEEVTEVSEEPTDPEAEGNQENPTEETTEVIEQPTEPKAEDSEEKPE